MINTLAFLTIIRKARSYRSSTKLFLGTQKFLLKESLKRMLQAQAGSDSVESSDYEIAFDQRASRPWVFAVSCPCGMCRLTWRPFTWKQRQLEIVEGAASDYSLQHANQGPLLLQVKARVSRGFRTRGLGNFRIWNIFLLSSVTIYEYLYKKSGFRCFPELDCDLNHVLRTCLVLDKDKCEIFQQITSILIIDGHHEIQKASLDWPHRFCSSQSPTDAKQNQNQTFGEREPHTINTM